MSAECIPLVADRVQPCVVAAEDELDLVVLARQGDRDAFATLIRRHSPRMLRLAERMLADREAAEDAVQDGVVSAWRNIGEFRGDAAFATWLHTIVARACLSQLRRAHRTESLDAITDADNRWADATYSVDPGDVVARASDAVTLGTALATLPASYRAALLLHDMDGLTAAEVADATGVPLGTAKARIRRARMAVVSQLAAGAAGNHRKEATGC
ncbi:MAG: RNA polymerase sigma factor RpoE [Acidimicrobiales bacterium]